MPITKKLRDEAIIDVKSSKLNLDAGCSKPVGRLGILAVGNDGAGQELLEVREGGGGRHLLLHALQLILLVHHVNVALVKYLSIFKLEVN